MATALQDIFWCGGGGHIFQLAAVGVEDLSQADIILGYSRETGNYLYLGEGLTAADLVFEVIDFSGDGSPESTVIRSSIDDSILAIVVNTVNAQGETLLSAADFVDTATVEARFAAVSEDASTAPEADLPAEPGQVGSSQAAASSSSVAGDRGAGSSATATDSADNTASSSETVYDPEGTASGCSAGAIASEDSVDTTADIQVSAAGFDVLIGTADNDVLVSTAGRTFFFGGGGADTFVLSDTGYKTLDAADVIFDFSAEAGDLIQLRGGLTFEQIDLKAIDINDNGVLDGTLISHATTGSIYALVLGTIDSLGHSILVGEHFSAPVLS